MDNHILCRIDSLMLGQYMNTMVLYINMHYIFNNC